MRDSTQLSINTLSVARATLCEILAIRVLRELNASLPSLRLFQVDGQSGACLSLQYCSRPGRCSKERQKK